jgi:hypothetical protein
MDAGDVDPAFPDAGSEDGASPDGGTPDAGPPPQRILTLPKPIPGSYIIMLKEKGPDGKPIKVRAVAQQLAKRYGGKITFIYESLSGFAVKGLSEEKAEALKKEPAVMGVDQDRPTQLIGPIKSVKPGQ